MNTRWKIVAVVVFLLGFWSIFLVVPRNKEEASPQQTEKVSPSRSTEVIVRVPVTLVDDQRLRIGRVFMLYLYPDRLAEAKPFLGKEATVEFVLGAPADAKDCLGTLQGIFDPATWIEAPPHRDEWCGTMRLFGVQLVEVGDVAATVRTPRGKTFTIVVPATRQAELRMVSGKKVSVSMYIDTYTQHFGLWDIRVLE